MLKALELSNAKSCLNKAAPDEPLFILRAKDPLAPQTILLWATMATSGQHEPAKIEEAQKIAAQMESYRRERYPEGNAVEVLRR